MSPDDPIESLKPPESPSRFRRRDPPPLPPPTTTESTSTKQSGTTPRESSVRFNLPPEEDDEDDDEMFRSPNIITSTPNPGILRGMDLLDHQENSFDSAKSFISAYHTPSSPSRGINSRFKRDSPSKLLRTLSRATSLTPSERELSIYHSQYDTPLLKGKLDEEGDEEDEVSLDEADKTLNSIIESTEDASLRIRKVLEQSKQDRSVRQRQQSLSPESSRNEKDDSMDQAVPEMSVWGEKSFFKRMAKRAPGGWAFTPQPKLGRVIDIQEEQKEGEVQEVYCLHDCANGRMPKLIGNGGDFGVENGRMCLQKAITNPQISLHQT